MKNVNGIVVYENLDEIVAPEHSCLVVWDVQNGLVNTIFNKDEFLGGMKRFIEDLRGKMPVVYTMITPLRRDFISSWGCYSAMKRFNVSYPYKLPQFMAAGSREREIPETVRPDQSDLVLEKSTANIFIGTNFEYLMRNRGITTMIFTGIAT